MNKTSLRSLRYLAVVISIASLLAWASSQNGRLIEGPFGAISVLVLCAVLAFVIQWIAFIPAYIKQTEHFYDLVGSLSYLSLVACAFLLSDTNDVRSLLLAALVVIWALRLGTFLFIRVSTDGSDSRFDEIKPNFFRFLVAWSIQGLWVFVTCGAALAAITAGQSVDMGWVGFLGVLIWVIGFGLEVCADHQKRVFRRTRKSEQEFIRSGLWAYSRHPNYFGEILLWLGISIIALPALSSWQYASLISPVFVFLLLTRVSGIPLLEASADKRWGGQTDYEQYKKDTPVLVPKLSSAQPKALEE